MSKEIATKITGKIKIKDPTEEKFILQLFITGILPNSARAVTNIKVICENYLKDRYVLDIIDIYQQPDIALAEEIVAIPLLIKKFPLPQVKLIGDLSDTELVKKSLDLVGDG